MALNNIKISYRLAIGFGLMLVLMVGIAAIAERVSRDARNGLNETVNRNNKKSEAASAMRQSLFRQGLIARKLGLTSDVDEMQRDMAQIYVQQKLYLDKEIELLGLGVSHEEQPLIDEMRQRRLDVEPFVKQAEIMVDGFNAGQALRIFTTHVAPIQEKWLGAIDLLVEQQNRHIRDDLAEFELRSRRATLLMAAICVVSLLLASIIASLITRSITGSVAQLLAFSNRVAKGDFSTRVDHGGEHEFAVLARAMNQMAESLESSQAQLLAAARIAGMAEIATNVLHNVGNVLNSVNISAGLIAGQLRTSRVKGLTKATRMMEERSSDLADFFTQDPRGKLLPAYLRELASALELEHCSMAEELGRLEKSVDHIKEVVATQQSYAGTPRMLETVKLDELIEDALRMNADALTRHKVTVVKELAPLPVLRLDRHRMLQILVNLIGNAKQAMDHAPTSNATITVQSCVVDGVTLRVAVIDNGEGILPENLTRIFSHGFTTRRDGHGFGLHSCVLAAQEMGGCLTGHSTGWGQGARFTLEVPLGSGLEIANSAVPKGDGETEVANPKP
ncbi:ATP-binding protein [Rhodoferax sp. WC2427]|uniref:ATP-binding protein n=1 Tax=Rhodoferax sp. WC2427 TaxID=3234144 RepID=UPI003466A88E